MVNIKNKIDPIQNRFLRYLSTIMFFLLEDIQTSSTMVNVLPIATHRVTRSHDILYVLVIDLCVGFLRVTKSSATSERTFYRFLTGFQPVQPPEVERASLLSTTNK